MSRPRLAPVQAGGDPRRTRLDAPSTDAGALDRLQRRLSELLATRVDVIPEPTEAGVIKTALGERCRAF